MVLVLSQFTQSAEGPRTGVPMSNPTDDDDIRNPRELIEDGVTRDLEEAEQIFMDEAATPDSEVDQPTNDDDDD
jgi:hypothetical protein